MKSLSIREPFATLIKCGVKKIETRSFKTNYRGEIYIHASVSIPKRNVEKLLELIPNEKLNPGKIICKCKLIDCIYMTDDYVNDMKINNSVEYSCGTYEKGRYAWILDDVEIIEPIMIKGQLGIWNFYSIDEVMKFMEDIKYNDNIDDNYKLQSPNEILKSKKGICWDQVELERQYLKNRDIHTYFICNYNGFDNPTHTFLVLKENNKFVWLEHSWEKYKGIHNYDTLYELLDDVENKFVLDNGNENVILREYKKPKYNISAQNFIKHCESFEIIDLDYFL